MSKLKTNFLYNTLFQVLTLIVPLITTPYISRILGANSIGIFSYTNANTNYFTLFASLGFSIYAQNEVARARNSRRKLSVIFTNILMARLLCSAAIYIIFICFNIFFFKSYHNLYWILSLQIISVIFDISWLFMGFEEFKKIAIKNLGIKFLNTILIFLLIHKPSDLNLYAFILMFGVLISNLILWLDVKKYVHRLDIKSMDIKSVLIPAVALFFPIAAVTVYTDVIRSFIGVVSTKSNVAFYVQADMLIKVILTVITSIGTIMMPHITRLLAEGKFDEVNRLIKKSFQFISFISFPIMFGVFVISENFIILFLGKNFIPAAKLMSIDAISIIFAAWSNVLGQQYMIPNKKLKEYTLSTTIPVTTIIFTLPILYYAFGVPGVMLAIVIVQLLIFLLQLFYCRSILNTKELFNGIPKIFLASIVMAVGIIMVNNVLKIESRFVFLSIDIILGALIYGITGIVLKIPEIDTFKNLILKNRK